MTQARLLASCAMGLSLPLIGHAHGGDHAEYHSHDFSQQALLFEPEQVDCVLGSGIPSRCLKLTVKHKPSDLNPGPFCPTTLREPGGIWNWTGENAGLYRVDASFLQMIAAQGFTMFDAQGDVHISDISKARPVEDHSCIEVSEDADVQITALIPIAPVKADAPQRLGIVSKIGVALNGSPIFSDAPSVHHTGHMPALDTCGGHVDPGGWYHWHANSNDIETVFAAQSVEAECALSQNPASMFGYAFDGFPIFGSLEMSGDIPTDLDACNGHTGPMPDGSTGYHYHTTTSFPNLPNCLMGETAQNNFRTTAQVGIGAQRVDGEATTRGEPPRGHRRGRPNLDQAAAQLGVATVDLKHALRRIDDHPPSVSDLAQQLGVSEQAVREALPPPPRRN